MNHTADHTAFRRPLAAGVPVAAPAVRVPVADVLDSGGDERHRRDAERLKAAALGVAAGVLAYVALAQASAAHVDGPGPSPTSLPARPAPGPAVAPVTGPSVALPTRGVVATHCPVRVRVHAPSEPGGPWVCFSTADEATRWLSEQRAAGARAVR